VDKHLFNGQWRTVTEISKITGDSKAALYQRKKKHPEKTYQQLAGQEFGRCGWRKDSKYPTMARLAQILDVSLPKFRDRIKAHGFQKAVEMDSKSQPTGMKKGAKYHGGLWTNDIDDMNYDPDLELKRRIERYQLSGLSSDEMLQRERRTI